MRILVIGSGGREHALVWKITQSKLADKIFCCPGNGGISDLAECIPIKADDIFGLLEFARREKIDLTVVGPEVPLSLGIVDEFQKNKLNIFGPNKRAANLEGSKVFSKELMHRYNVPTAAFNIFHDPQEAKKFIEYRPVPCVIKADGLAQGKGVIIAQTIDEGKDAVRLIMEDRAFGSAGNKIIIEDCLQGQEASILVITDSRETVVLASAQDHKRVFTDDRGPNTGGMGAYSPTPVVTDSLFKEILDKIIYPTIDGLVKEGIEYQGVLYAGVMITKDGPKVLEFNVRFGDPETQVILPRLNSDLLEVMLACSHGSLSKIIKSGGLKWDKRACVCVVCASGGYPASFEKDKEISGLDKVNKIKDVVVFHAGTKKSAVHSPQSTVKYLTNGGRVLGITGLGNTINEAIKKTYKAVEKIGFDGMHYRRDIGRRAVDSI
ncbi:MAG: phosphoribosylamine--glycine ligase [Candidatus Omnitrophica bacterium]|nr:phosphoribosylamine--glycine ligase [Candidatus Omnitrophota bacterium]